MGFGAEGVQPAQTHGGCHCGVTQPLGPSASAAPYDRRVNQRRFDRVEDLLRAAFPPPDAVDDFGVPLRFFGDHPEWMWPAVGRTVGVSALLEDHLATLLIVLTLQPEKDVARLRVSAVVTRLRAAAPTTQDWAGFPGFLDRTDELLKWRNAVVHSLWPAQPGGALFGHRRDPKTGERLIVEATPEQLRERLTELAVVTDEWQKWFALAGVESRRLWDARERLERDARTARSDGAPADGGQA